MADGSIAKVLKTFLVDNPGGYTWGGSSQGGFLGNNELGIT